MLKYDSSEPGQLLIQCGGYGNLQRILLLARRVTELNEFNEYFTNMYQSRYFAKSDDTTKLLRKIGYVNIKVHLNNDRISLTNREIYSRFVKTVVLKPFLERLPDNKTRNRYLELFLDEVEKKDTSTSSDKDHRAGARDREVARIGVALAPAIVARCLRLIQGVAGRNGAADLVEAGRVRVGRADGVATRQEVVDIDDRHAPVNFGFGDAAIAAQQ